MEIQGMLFNNRDIKSSDFSLVEIKDIDNFKERPLKTYDIISSCRQVLITCYPNYEGSDEFALVATTYINKQIVIMGLDSHLCQSIENTEFFLECFIEGLKKHPWLSSAVFIFIPERNCGSESDHLIKAFVKMCKNGIAIYQKSGPIFGWWTTNYAKFSYFKSTTRVLNECAVFFCEGWVCTNPWIKDDETRRSIIQAKFFDQLAHYQMREDQTRPGYFSYVPKFLISYKVDDEGRIQRTQDDESLCFTFTMNIGMWDHILQRLIIGFPYNLLYLDDTLSIQKS